MYSLDTELKDETLEGLNFHQHKVKALLKLWFQFKAEKPLVIQSKLNEVRDILLNVPERARCFPVCLLRWVTFDDPNNPKDLKNRLIRNLANLGDSKAKERVWHMDHAKTHW